MWDQEALKLLQNLSLEAGERAVTCRLWTGDRRVFKLGARDIRTLKDEAKELFKIQEDEAYSHILSLRRKMSGPAKKLSMMAKHLPRSLPS